MQHIAQKKGFAIMFAVLIASLLATLGVALAGLALKELALSSSGRESQFSFYAADSGIECARFWDISDIFSSSTRPLSENISCADFTDTPNSITVTKIFSSASNADSATSTFQVNLDSGKCAIVSVVKNGLASGLICDVRTSIQSWGYNVCPGTVSPLRVERAIRVKYTDCATNSCN